MLLCQCQVVLFIKTYGHYMCYFTGQKAILTGTCSITVQWKCGISSFEIQTVDKHTSPNMASNNWNMVCSSFRGIRDDLTILLEEDLSSTNLCALHCELRNTEQLLTSLGLFAYKVGSLQECNEELSQYGPENFNSRITVKLKEGPEFPVERHFFPPYLIKHKH